MNYEKQDQTKPDVMGAKKMWPRHCGLLSFFRHCNDVVTYGLTKVKISLYYEVHIIDSLQYNLGPNE